jgi:hypothetical protein
MKKRKILTTIVCSQIMTFAFAGGEEPKTPQWYDVVVGIIAIPSAIVGLVYSVALIRNTRLESEKAKLEIEEKRKALNNETTTTGIDPKHLIEPIIQANQVQLIILRFILLYVVLSLWSLVDSAYNLLTVGTYLGLQTLNERMLEGKFVQIILFIFTKLPEIGEWTIKIGLGIPIFKDISQILGINIRTIILPWKSRNGIKQRT